MSYTLGVFTFQQNTQQHDVLGLTQKEQSVVQGSEAVGGGL